MSDKQQMHGRVVGLKVHAVKIGFHAGSQGIWDVNGVQRAGQGNILHQHQPRSWWWYNNLVANREQQKAQQAKTDDAREPGEDASTCALLFDLRHSWWLWCILWRNLRLC